MITHGKNHPASGLRDWGGLLPSQRTQKSSECMRYGVQTELEIRLNWIHDEHFSPAAV